jgi:hypothetical protein
MIRRGFDHLTDYMNLQWFYHISNWFLFIIVSEEKTKAFCNWLLFCLIPIECSYITGLTFHVSHYGAHSTDNFDDAKGVQLAILDAINSAPDNDVVFGSGTYNLSFTIQVAGATNLTMTGQGIDKIFLVGNSSSSIFSIESSQGLKITSLSNDFDPLPFTAAYANSVNNSYLDLKVEASHQTNVNQQVQAFLWYDSVALRLAVGPNAYEIYQTPSSSATTILVSPGILRIPLSFIPKFAVWDSIVVRYDFQSHVLGFVDVEDLTIQSIKICTFWCMRFLFCEQDVWISMITMFNHEMDAGWVPSLIVYMLLMVENIFQYIE